MERIKRIEVRPTTPEGGDGVKGQMFREDLAGCDLFVGGNGTGKTTRLLAVLLAIDGIASTPTSPRKVYLGDPPANTTVAVELEGGAEVARDLSMTRGKVVQEADARAEAFLGRAPVSWDLRDFASSSEGERNKMLERVMRAAAEMRRWTGTDAFRWLGDHAEAKNPMIAWLHEELPPTNIKDGSRWLGYAADAAKKRFSAINADHRRCKAAAERQGQEKIPDLKWGQEQVSELAAAKQALLTEMSAERDYQAEIRETQAWQDRELELVEASTRIQGDIGAVMERGKRLSAQIKAWREPTPDLTPYHEAVQRAREEMDKPIGRDIDLRPIKSRIEELESALGSARKREGELRVILTRDGSVLDGLNKERAQLEAVLEDNPHELITCRHCGGKDPLNRGEQIRKREARLKVVLREIKELEHLGEFAVEVEQLTGEMTALKAQLDRARQSLEEAQKERSGSEDEQRRRAALEHAHEALKHAEEAASDTLMTARASLKAWKRERNEARETYRGLQTRLKEVAGKLEMHRDNKPGTPREADPSKLQELKGEVSRLEKLKEQAKLAEAQRRRAVQILKDYDAAAVQLTQIKELRKLLDAAKQALARSAYEPINEAARGLLEAAPELPDPFFRGPDEYGARVRGRDIPYHALSQSEQQVTAAAIVYALSAISGQRCKLVLLDGIEVIQRDHRAPLLAALAQAVERGDVDNVIATIATAPDEEVPEIPGVLVHVLGRQEEDDAADGDRWQREMDMILKAPPRRIPEIDDKPRQDPEPEPEPDPVTLPLFDDECPF